MDLSTTVAAALAVAALLGLLAALAVALARVRRLEARVEAMEGSAGALRRELGDQLGVLSAAAVDKGEHLVRVERDLHRLRDRLSRLAGGADNEAQIDQAIRMASRGAGVREIMEGCGLSQVEADLIVLLHRADES